MGELGQSVGRPYSVTPTFDSRVIGEPYSVEVRENDRRRSIKPMPDPFHNTTIRPRGWRVALAVLLRRYSVSVHVDANRQLIEDVLELDDNYRGIAEERLGLSGASIIGRCGNCDQPTDRLPCPHCAVFLTDDEKSAVREAMRIAGPPLVPTDFDSAWEKLR